MELEVTADVHTVHPTDPRPINRDSIQGRANTTQGRSNTAQGRTNTTQERPTTYGSWGSPDVTPQHAGLGNTYSQIKIEEGAGYRDDTGTFVGVQKVRLFSYSPTPSKIYPEEEDEPTTELRDLKKTISRENSFKKITESDICEALPVETPQSPIPSSPPRDKKCKGLRFPTFCDPCMTIDPQGRGYISWLFLVTFCYSYNAWCVPLRASFPYQTLENTPKWMVADYICDLVYLIDLVFVKPRLMFLHEGFWVNDPKETRRNYWSKLQYKFDLISLMPLDLLYLYFGPQMVILRFPRIFKLQTFWEFHQAVDRVLSSPYVVRIGKTLFYIFYLIHLNACAYYVMSAYIGLGSNGWVYDNRGNAYIRCFYFATKTATSIGNVGDKFLLRNGKNPKPENTLEFLYMTMAWLMGVFVFALLIGQIRDILTTATRVRTEYKKTLDGSTRYLRELNMPLHIQRRVTDWFNYTWSQQRCFDESRILDSLPFNMKRDVALEVHMSTLSKVQLFRDCSESLLRDLVLQLRPVTFLPGDVVVRRGDVGHVMYIIKNGECYVMSQNEKEVLATLREGSVFGEISLLGIEGLRRRTATVRSRGYSSLFALSKSDLDAALKHHKEAEKILRVRADQILRENAARQVKQRMAEESAKKSQEEHSAARRKHSANSSEGNTTEGKRNRSASAQSRMKLPSVTENPTSERKPNNIAGNPSRTPLPRIIFSSE